MGVSYIILFGALALRLGLAWSNEVVHGLLCFKHFCFLFWLLLARGVIQSITIFIIGYIINTSLTTGLISFFFHLIFLIILLCVLFFVLAPSSQLHIAAVKLDLGNKVCNGTIFFFILIYLVILEGPLVFIQIERLNLLCVAFLVTVTPLQLMRDGRILASVAIRREEGYLLSCKHL